LEAAQGGANIDKPKTYSFLPRKKNHIRITFEERIFKLERDEQAFID
jgi:hypothetical protein